MKTYESKDSRLALAKTIAQEGIVLLKNEQHLLPLKKGTSIAVFGRAQLETLIGGGGSGASSSEEATILIDELKKVGLEPQEDMENFYRKELEHLYKNSPSEEDQRKELVGLVNSGLIYEIFGRYTPPAEEFLIRDDLVQNISPDMTALLVIGRGSGGEECDRRIIDDYYLTESEKQLITLVAEHFHHVILILNSNGFIDLSWIQNYPSLQAVCYLGTAGEQGAAALAGLLVGDASPSGKLSATIACSYEDYPSSPYFFTNKDKPETILTYEDFHLSSKDNGSVGFSKSPVAFYQEGIYVGYRYFDTFNKPVLYPFGFGLSYSDFTISFLSGEAGKDALTLTVKVTNTGREFSGKEVVQVYISAPGGKLDKPYQELITYEKTKELAPGKSQTLTLSLPYRELASYEEATASYLIEAGDYYIRLGNSSRNTKIIGKITVKDTIMEARYQNRLTLHPANTGKLHFLEKNNTSSYTYSGELAEKAVAPCLYHLTQEDITVRTSLASAPITAPADLTEINTGSKLITAAPGPDAAAVTDTPDDNPVITLSEVKAGKASMEEFTAQFSIEELAVLLNGYGPGLPFGGMGSDHPATIQYENGENIATSTHPTGAFGYLSPALLKYGIPSVFYKDGPASVHKTAWPTGMSMACTFNKELLYEFGNACGTEAEEIQVDCWLAPAVNLQRSPIGGRNFEYYSEDPRHSGFCGLAITLGVEENHKVTTCPKHFALNEQETYRRGSIKKSYDALDSIVEERAARELYLKPFEMIVRGSNVSAFMTSFNKINGIFAAGNQDLCEGILREEWGYKGIVVTDWGDMDIVADGADAVAAGNDIIMPGGPPVIQQVLKGYEAGRVTLSKLRKAVSNLMYFVMNSGSYERFKEEQRMCLGTFSAPNAFTK